MESKKLEALMMSVDLGSFTRAAEVLGYTQSGLTHMMNSLEKEIGVPLLERGRGGVRLTPEGERRFLIEPAMPLDTALIGRDVAVTSHDKVVLAVEPLGAKI